MQGLKRVFALLAVMGVVLLPSQALAQEPSQSGYSANDTAVVEDQSGETSETSGGSLPFTGLDVVLLVVAGGALLGLGLGMRRLTRSPANV